MKRHIISGVKITLSGRTEQGFAHEKGDCTVRATANILNIPYAESHARLKALGRKDGKGVCFRLIAQRLGLEELPQFANRTVKAILPQLGKGRYGILINRHIFAVVDGEIIDSHYPLNHRVWVVYKPTVQQLSPPAPTAPHFYGRGSYVFQLVNSGMNSFYEVLVTVRVKFPGSGENKVRMMFDKAMAEVNKWGRAE